jgi:hypothetical protein
MTDARTNSGITWRYRRMNEQAFQRYKERRAAEWKQYGMTEDCKRGMTAAWNMLKHELNVASEWLDNEREYYGLRRAA